MAQDPEGPTVRAVEGTEAGRVQDVAAADTFCKFSEHLTECVRLTTNGCLSLT